MQKSVQSDVLMDEDGIRITDRQISTPNGEFSVEDIKAAESRIARPVWGPLLLGVLGTLNLAIAFQSAFWLDFAASGVMLGGGLYWWTRGTKYVLILTLSQGEMEVWLARHESQLQQALRIIQQRLVECRDRSKV